MNRGLVIIIGLILVGMGYLAVRGAPNSTPRPARPIKLATGTWEPFVGPNLEGGGPIGQVVAETIQRMGYEPELSFSSWDLTLDRTRRAEVLGAFPFIRSAERDARYVFSDSILAFEYVLFYHKPRLPNPDAIRSVEDLAEYRVGKVVGYDVWPALEAAVPAFITLETSTAAFRALARGDIDFLPEGRIPGLATIRGPDLRADASEFGFLDATDHPMFGATEGLHFLMPRSREARTFLNGFNAALAEVKETALYREAEAQLRGAAPPMEVVELRPIPGAAYPTVVPAEGEATPFAVPLGTRAMVLAWPPRFTPQGTAPPGRCTVKLLNGPQRGRVVLVDVRAVTLTREPVLP